jgi:hypothetical protein
MSGSTTEKPATSIEGLDIHLDYLRRDVSKLLSAVENMATRDDIKRLEGQMGQFATRDELRALEAKMQTESVPSTLERWATWIQKIGSAAAIVGGAAVLLSHLLERIK